MKTKEQKKTSVFDDDAADVVATLAGKATRKAARVARAAGYLTVCKKNTCIVTSPGRASVTVHLKNTRINAAKHYTFAEAAR